MRTIVVTGSASGIGRATQQILHDHGNRVIGVDRHDADLRADLSTLAGRGELADAVTARTNGQIDGVVANAGVAGETPDVVTVNFFGAVATLERLRPLLERSATPRAVVTASMASLLPSDAELVDLCLAGDEPAAVVRATRLVDAGQGGLLYPSSKVALCRWVRRAAAGPRWAGAGIPLNAIAPGVVETPMVAPMIDTPQKRQALAAMVPMPLHGFMTPETPARLLAWLVGVENSHLCGQVVFVDGGSDVVLRGDSTW
ncbi:NAD(P)-dependent dehydrogenase (short-subunit alcohol dehydrogenase family) [Isoptericola jiangsuensis]|uniref:NAD(P)-dependent dehydrogenase (Short-subunit alcohol dehydrogenase family) n=1 Tax=Isoptericola jiangsuensis TaxID=548579 RepID=A0A2A9EXE6_9MICO|nr:SDR family oxidoreductase [Isoptericola jiangsuensis]PFG43558.1 NAD(P)-dependent dehydrogenase (short-subunit alcohol dehydrogenase family) [Isoptericola jiangsuensis]